MGERLEKLARQAGRATAYAQHYGGKALKASGHLVATGATRYAEIRHDERLREIAAAEKIFRRLLARGHSMGEAYDYIEEEFDTGVADFVLQRVQMANATSRTPEGRVLGKLRQGR